MKELIVQRQCDFSAEVISYVYNEMADADRDRFDNHLADCSACIDELAELSHSYFSVYEWRKLEFDPLPTPFFEIPRASERASWVTRLQELFSPNRALLAGGSFAAILMAAFVGIAIWKSANKPDLAVVNDDPIAAANTAGNTVRPARPEARELFPEVTEVVEAPDTTVREIAPGSSSVKKAARLRPKVVKASAAETVRTPVQTVRRDAVASTDTTPQLTEFEELQDESLRLSDILDDIDTSD